MRTLLSATIAFTLMMGLHVTLTAGPTTGWTQKSYTYAIQTPWNLPQSDRYSFVSPKHTFWIYKGDACQFEGCSTGPRSELRMNNDYKTGAHQFEGDVYISAGSDGTDICQVFGGVTNATSFMMKITSANNGTLKRYDNETLATNAYGRWIHVNIQHQATTSTGKIYIYIDNVLKLTCDDRGYTTHYFKCGVYNITGSMSRTQWKNVKYWVNGPVGKSGAAETATTPDDNNLFVSTAEDGTTNINYTLAENNFAKMVLYNSNGQVVKTIYEGNQLAGSHIEKWDNSLVAHGLYIVKLSIGNKTYTAKIVK